MRKEDRKPSKRVFPLLQNLDLDTVTFANVQGVGDSITIEDMNEQELQDLVLVRGWWWWTRSRATQGEHLVNLQSTHGHQVPDNRI